MYRHHLILKALIERSNKILEMKWLGKLNLYAEYVSWNSSFEIAFLVAKDRNVRT